MIADFAGGFFGRRVFSDKGLGQHTGEGNRPIRERHAKHRATSREGVVGTG
jgi:hypothetical protein